MKKSLFLFIVVLFVAQISCQQETIKPAEKKIINLDEKSAQLVESDNTFGLKLFKEVREMSNKENIMISPFSVSIALGMTYNGAAGDTKTEIAKVLQLNGLTPEQINNSYETLIKALKSLDKDVVFEIANAIYYRTGFDVKQPFLDINSNYYDAEVNSLNFNLPSALAEINGWVNEKTHQKIPKILEKLSPGARMVLLNAIYFNGIWAVKFDKTGTKLRPFYKNDGTNNDVAMMHKESKFEYTLNELFDAVKLPYGNGQYNMIVMRPAEGKTSHDIINQLTAETWQKLTEEFVPVKHVFVSMPRFKFSFDIGLKEVLEKMEMVKAFDKQKADFSNISDDDLYISNVIHKSFIDVNETGTEAAAVTAVVFTTTSAGWEEEKKIYFNVNKPFVFAITEKDTGAILFIGEVQNPEYEL